MKKEVAYSGRKPKNGKPKGKKKAKKGGNLFDRFLRICKEYEFHWWHLFMAVFLFLWVLASTYKEERPEPAPRRGNGFEDFTGYDPQRGIEGVCDIDYGNKTLSYYPIEDKTAPSGGGTAAKKRTIPSSGTTIYDNSGKSVHIDADPEDILEQLRGDIDFDDLADEYDYDGEW